MYDKEVVELSGLVEVEEDDEGQVHYIGTDKQWEMAEKIQAKFNLLREQTNG